MARSARPLRFVADRSVRAGGWSGNRFAVVFQEFGVSGIGFDQIATLLNAEGVPLAQWGKPTRTPGKKWHGFAINPYTKICQPVMWVSRRRMFIRIQSSVQPETCPSKIRTCPLKKRWVPTIDRPNLLRNICFRQNRILAYRSRCPA